MFAEHLIHINSLLDASPDKTLVGEQLDRMETTVTHQLSKASASGPVVVGKSVPLGALVERLLRALETAYVERGIAVETKLDAAIEARGVHPSLRARDRGRKPQRAAPMYSYYRRRR